MTLALPLDGIRELRKQRHSIPVLQGADILAFEIGLRGMQDHPGRQHFSLPE